VALVSMGTTASTARAAVDRARESGLAAGSLRVRLFRPLPEAALSRALEGISRVAVVDRDLSPGMGGILWGETRALAGPGAMVQGYVMGLGGGDIRPEHLEEVLRDVACRERPGPPAVVEVAA
jgi:pyruvate/2-oxoacid:ferredoxin oxidoreductase alpha subunit